MTTAKKSQSEWDLDMFDEPQLELDFEHDRMPSEELFEKLECLLDEPKAVEKPEVEVKVAEGSEENETAEVELPADVQESPGEVDFIEKVERLLLSLSDVDKPWSKDASLMSDHFNFGFSESAWLKFCESRRIKAAREKEASEETSTEKSAKEIESGRTKPLAFENPTVQVSTLEVPAVPPSNLPIANGQPGLIAGVTAYYVTQTGFMPIVAAGAGNPLRQDNVVVPPFLLKGEDDSRDKAKPISSAVDCRKPELVSKALGSSRADDRRMKENRSRHPSENYRHKEASSNHARANGYDHGRRAHDTNLRNRLERDHPHERSREHQEGQRQYHHVPRESRDRQRHDQNRRGEYQNMERTIHDMQSTYRQPATNFRQPDTDARQSTTSLRQPARENDLRNVCNSYRHRDQTCANECRFNESDNRTQPRNSDYNNYNSNNKRPRDQSFDARMNHKRRRI